MLQGLLIKKIIDIVMKQLLKQFDFNKIQKYVEQPNELDKQVKSLQKTVNKYGKYIEEVEKSIAILKKVAHPKANFVCTSCGTKAKRVKGKLNKIKEKF
jgi:prefoldin subunit 5